MEELIQLLHAVTPMRPPLEKRLRSIIRRFDFTKGQVIVKEGDVGDMIFYIKQGLVRSYYVLNGREVTNWFMKEGDICVEVLGFLGGLPSPTTLIALEPCECYGIYLAELEETYTLHPEFERHGRLITAKYYVQSEVRNMSNKRQTNVRKYEILMHQFPDLLIRADKEQVATFLDMSGRTFRRVQDSYARKQSSTQARKKRGIQK